MRFRGYAHGPFGQVHFQVQGTGQPLLLCHQSPSSLRQFDPVYPLLAAAGVMAIGVDTPGFGQSEVPDIVPTIENYADSIVAMVVICRNCGIAVFAAPALGRTLRPCIAGL